MSAKNNSRALREIRGMLRGTRPHVLYDSLRVHRGLLDESSMVLFADHVGVTARVFGGGPHRMVASYIKTLSDTNQAVGGMMPNGQSMIVDRVEVSVKPATAAAALTECVTAEFWLDGRVVMAGKLKWFPARRWRPRGRVMRLLLRFRDWLLGIMPDPLLLQRPLLLESLHRFEVRLRVPSPGVDLPEACRIEFALVGQLIFPI
jgi:hypothetical protein